MKYKFRAKCMNDVCYVLYLLGDYDVNIKHESGYPDVTVELECNKTLDELMPLLRDIVDGHVMVETIEEL